MKAIIFDLDDTLVDWKPEFIFALKEVLKEMNYNFSIDVINHINRCIDEFEKHDIKLTKEGLLNYINNNCNIKLPIEFIDNLIVKQGNCIYDDRMLPKVLEYLSNKYDLYVITNWFTKTQETRLENMHVLKYFKKVIGADINYFKPQKRAFDIILKEYDAKDCISVGDSLENDVIIPLSLGMDAIWKTSNLSDKYKTINEIKELMDIL